MIHNLTIDVKVLMTKQHEVSIYIHITCKHNDMLHKYKIIWNPNNIVFKIKNHRRRNGFKTGRVEQCQINHSMGLNHYCGLLPCTNTSGECKSVNKHVHVQVRQNGHTVYTA